MNVYSLIAWTRSEIRDVLLSIVVNSSATSIEHSILTSAARAVSASRLANKGSSTCWLYVPPRKTSRELPQVILAVTSQQRINLVFQAADGQRIGRGPSS